MALGGACVHMWISTNSGWLKYFPLWFPLVSHQSQQHTSTRQLLLLTCSQLSLCCAAVIVVFFCFFCIILHHWCPRSKWAALNCFLRLFDSTSFQIYSPQRHHTEASQTQNVTFRIYMLFVNTSSGSLQTCISYTQRHRHTNKSFIYLKR